MFNFACFVNDIKGSVDLDTKQGCVKDLFIALALLVKVLILKAIPKRFVNIVGVVVEDSHVGLNDLGILVCATMEIQSVGMGRRTRWLPFWRFAQVLIHMLEVVNGLEKHEIVAFFDFT